MARSSRTKSSVSIDLFNLPPLPDAKKHPAMISEIQKWFLSAGRKEYTTQQGSKYMDIRQTYTQW